MVTLSLWLVWMILVSRQLVVNGVFFWEASLMPAGSVENELMPKENGWDSMRQHRIFVSFSHHT